MALTLGLLGASPAVAGEGGPTAGISALAEADPTHRGLAVDFWKSGGPGVKAAAEAALIGSDADVQAFLAAAEELTLQDSRVSAAQIASVGGTELLAAARKALAGTPAELEDFLDDGWEDPLEQDQRVRVAQVVDSGGPAVQEAGRV
ncbi:ALF repeat-containing protein, partial [Streptomyces rubiginosohelvolus]